MDNPFFYVIIRICEKITKIIDIYIQSLYNYYVSLYKNINKGEKVMKKILVFLLCLMLSVGVLATVVSAEEETPVEQ